MKLRKAVKIAFLAAVTMALGFGCLRSANAGATITVVNLDSLGEGFNDTSAPDPDSTAGNNDGVNLGQQRLIAFQYAADIWAEPSVWKRLAGDLGCDTRDEICERLAIDIRYIEPIYPEDTYEAGIRQNMWGERWRMTETAFGP